MNREFFILAFEAYEQRKKEHRLYNKQSTLPDQLISLYYQENDNPEFSMVYEQFKKNYIFNESKIDEILSDEETKGLSLVYDYIRDYDFSKKKFNVFVEALKIHTLLYSQCPYPEFGGQLRDDSVILNNAIIEVPPADEAKKYFQSYITKEIPRVDFNESVSIFDYINSCIYVTTELMKNQPFCDGNKRTFRALLNLMLKQYNLPPVYIKIDERKEYKDALLKAMDKKDYTSLNQFYYYKICDSIYELDIAKPEEKAKQKSMLKYEEKKDKE